MDQAVDVRYAARRAADWSSEEQRINDGRRVPARLADALGEIRHVSGDADFAIRVWRIDPADQPALRRAADEVARAGGPRPAGDDDLTVPGTRPPAFAPGPRETRA